MENQKQLGPHVFTRIRKGSSMALLSEKCFACKASPTFLENPFLHLNLAYHSIQSSSFRFSSSMQSQQEMTVVEVNKKLLQKIEELGFPYARAVWALHYSGNASLEDAVNWIIDHENDADFDQMPEVAEIIDIESPQSDHETEEIIRKAQELRDRARKKREEGERKLERQREKERIRAGKELLQAKRIAEENERKRFLAMRTHEREEDRERIRLKLDADKVEKRLRLGLPSENPKANSPPAMPITKAEHMRECLRSLKRNHKGDDTKVRRAFHTLLIYVENVMKNPNEEKFRRIRISNPLFQDRVANLRGGIEFLELCGFEKTDRGDFLILPRDKVEMTTLNSAGSLLRSAITNPFFGVFSSG